MSEHIAKRQDLGGPLGGLFGPDGGANGQGDASSSPAINPFLTPFAPVLTNLLPTTTSISLLPNSIDLTDTSTSTGTTTTSTSQTPLVVTTTTTTSTSLTPTTPQPIITPPPLATTTVYTPSPPTSTSSGVPASGHQSFLENKPLAGGVFAFLALLVLILLVGAVTWALRRARNRDRLESLSFDPDVTTDAYGGMEQAGKGGWSGGDRVVPANSSSHGHDLYSESAMYPNYGPNPYPVLPDQDIAYTQPGYHQGWNAPVAYATPPSLMPGYQTTSQAQYPFASNLSQLSSDANARPVNPSRMKDTLPPLPVGAEGGESGAPHGAPSSVSTPAAASLPPAPPKDTNVVSSRLPVAPPLPDSFGSDSGNRESAELDAQFWGRTLKIANQ